MSGHSLDWANQPKVFKEYPGITPLSLARELQIPKGKLSAILGERFYVAAEAMGPECCGIGALYDGPAMEMLGRIKTQGSCIWWQWETSKKHREWTWGPSFDPREFLAFTCRLQ